ncbi:MAG: hypothetical protein JXK16_05875 [Thiotrichales bacterium]|nr:hypothetical protein [Thiotrichales bacterium]
MLKNVSWLKAAGLLILMLSVTQGVKASDFVKGETVFVAFPATNIKDDAFIIGKVTAITDKGDYQVAVLDYVEGHDYGSSCVPISKYETTDQGMGNGWEIWTDTTKLDTQQLEYVVPKEKVLKLAYGKLFFVERNNVFIVFGRWKSDAPVLTLDRLDQAISQAKSAGLSEMQPAFELAKLHRQSYYGDFERPLMPYESIAPLNKALKTVLEYLAADPRLEALWRANPRDWKAISETTKHYFLVEAIDKLVRDAKNAIYEEGVEQADATSLAELKERLSILKR